MDRRGDGLDLLHRKLGLLSAVGEREGGSGIVWRVGGLMVAVGMMIRARGVEVCRSREACCSPDFWACCLVLAGYVLVWDMILGFFQNAQGSKYW